MSPGSCHSFQKSNVCVGVWCRDPRVRLRLPKQRWEFLGTP